MDLGPRGEAAERRRIVIGPLFVRHPRKAGRRQSPRSAQKSSWKLLLFYGISAKMRGKASKRGRARRSGGLFCIPLYRPASSFARRKPGMWACRALIPPRRRRVHTRRFPGWFRRSPGLSGRPSRRPPGQSNTSKRRRQKHEEETHVPVSGSGTVPGPDRPRLRRAGGSEDCRRRGDLYRPSGCHYVPDGGQARLRTPGHRRGADRGGGHRLQRLQRPYGRPGHDRGLPRRDHRPQRPHPDRREGLRHF